jgi:peptide/nickel transport system permease protein
MLKYIGKRLLVLIPTLLCITFLVQLFLAITPGDPARLMAGNQASEEEVEALREEMGLNDPVLVRYAHYMINLFQGNLGKSFRTKNPVISEISERFPYTLLLVFISVILSLLIGIPTGIYAATHQYSWKDNLSILLSLFFVSMPSFWFALLLIQFLCVKLKILPVAGVDSWVGWILPCLTCALAYAASVARQMRSNMLEVIRQDYITTARAKGQTERKVLYKHALRNAIIPIIMTIGGIFGIALGGSMVTESIFGIPGLGSYTISALSARDYPVIQTSVLFLSTLNCLVLLLIDIAFAIVDPRIREQYSGK